MTGAKGSVLGMSRVEATYGPRATPWRDRLTRRYGMSDQCATRNEGTSSRPGDASYGKGRRRAGNGRGVCAEFGGKEGKREAVTKYLIAGELNVDRDRRRRRQHWQPWLSSRSWFFIPPPLPPSLLTVSSPCKRLWPVPTRAPAAEAPSPSLADPRQGPAQEHSLPLALSSPPTQGQPQRTHMPPVRRLCPRRLSQCISQTGRRGLQ